MALLEGEIRRASANPIAFAGETARDSRPVFLKRFLRLNHSIFEDSDLQSTGSLEMPRSEADV